MTKEKAYSPELYFERDMIGSYYNLGCEQPRSLQHCLINDSTKEC